MVSTTGTTVVVRMDERQERVLQDRAVKVPLAAELLRKEVPQNENEENRAKSTPKGTRRNGDSMRNDEDYLIVIIADHSNEDGK